MRHLSRRLLIASLAACCAVTPSHAAPPANPAAAEDADEKEVARSIDLRGLVFPVFDEKGKLKNYIFVNARMLVANGKDPWKVREKAHLIRDAVVRAAHRTSFNVKGDYTKLDEKLAAAACIKAGNEGLGEKDVLVTMTFTQIASRGG
jgi:hypothetical protein